MRQKQEVRTRTQECHCTGRGKKELDSQEELEVPENYTSRSCHLSISIPLTQ